MAGASTQDASARSDGQKAAAEGPIERIPRWAWWLGIGVAWTVLAFLLGASRVLIAPGDSLPPPWGRALKIAFLDMYSWGAVALAATWTAQRIRMDRARWGRGLVLHLGAGLAILLLRFFLANGFAAYAGWIPRMPAASWFFLVLPMNLITYTAWVGVGYAIAYYRKYRDQELQATRLELASSELRVELIQAQLQALKVQLHPHFIFNTLHAISTLVHQDPARADRMISRLSDLLRSALAYQEEQEVTLREEIELLAPYVEIEQMRFGPRLRIHMSLDPETLQARLPHLLLQPLIENAIRHGIAPRKAGGWIKVCSARRGDHLRLYIRDNGSGLHGGGASGERGGGEGVGLSNVRARLRKLYGTDHRFSIENHEEGGVEVEIYLPFRHAGVEAQPC